MNFVSSVTIFSMCFCVEYNNFQYIFSCSICMPCSLTTSHDNLLPGSLQPIYLCSRNWRSDLTFQNYLGWKATPLQPPFLPSFIRPYTRGFLFGFQRTVVTLCIFCKSSWKISGFEYRVVCQQHN